MRLPAALRVSLRHPSALPKSAAIKTPKIPCKTLLCLALVISPTSFCFGASDQPEYYQYSRMIQSLKTADHVLVYVIPAHTFFRGNLNEDRLRQVACRYTVTDPGNGRSILANILRSHPVTFSPQDRSLDLRVGLEIGDRKMFLEDAKFSDQSKQEMRVEGHFEGSSFAASARLVDEIRNIVITHDFEQIRMPDRFCTAR